MRLSIVTMIVLTAAWMGSGQPLAGLGAVRAAVAALPPGHPELPGIAAPTQPASHADIAVRVLQGTQNAAAVAGEPIAIEMYYQGKIIRKIDARLDDKGVALIDDIPLTLPFQPVLKVVHQGVEYQAVGDVADSQHPTQQIELTVYEASDQTPAWQLHMRHVIIDPSPQGVKVTEMLAMQNPSDRTWLGAADASGARVTMALALPAGTQQIELGGDLTHSFVKIENERLVSAMPLQPGWSQVQLTYRVPAKDGQVNLTFTAPGPVKQMILFVPQGGAVAKVSGLEALGVQETGKGKMQTFRGVDLAAGHQTVVIASLAAPPIRGGGAADVPKIIAGVGAGLILAVGVFIVLLRMPKPAQVK